MRNQSTQPWLLAAFVAILTATASADVIMEAVRKPAYASELFGPGSDDLVLDYVEGAEPKVHLVLGRGLTAVTAGNPQERALFEFDLSGAEFASRVKGTDLRFVRREIQLKDGAWECCNWGNTRALAPAREMNVIVEGGRRGDTSVAFDVTYTDGSRGVLFNARPTDGTPVHVESVIELILPPLTKTAEAMGPGGRGIKITASVDVIADPTTQIGGFDVFPAENQMMPPPNQTKPELGKRTVIDAAFEVNAAGNLVRKAAHSGLVVVHTPAENGLVNVLDRTTFTGLPNARAGHYLLLGSTNITVTSGVAQSDGTQFSVRRRDDGAGVLDISVTGNVRMSDTVIFDIDGDGKAGRGETLDYDSDTGAHMGSFGLDALLTDPEGESTMVFPPEGAEPTAGQLIYMPDDKDDMRSGSIGATLVVDYNRATNRDIDPAGRARSPLAYGISGLPMGARKAYALAAMSDGDESNVRIRCESNSDCAVWLSCDSAAGDNFFGMMPAPVSAWSTTAVRSADIADIVGAEDADFAGGMSCEAIGFDLTVQVLSRSGGTLVNTTYVND